MRSLVDMQIQVLPGTGMVGSRSGTVVAFATRTEPTKAAPIMDLIEEHQGRELVRLLARYVSESDPAAVPSFGVISDDPEGPVFLVHGNMSIELHTAEGVQTQSGRESLTFIDGFVGEADRIEIHPPNARSEPNAWPGALVDGIVPGGGLVLVSDPAAPIPDHDGAPPPPPITDEPESVEGGMEESDIQDEADFEPVDLAELDLVATKPLQIAKPPEPDVGSSTPAPHLELIAGIRCARGHFNHPDSRFCAHCGIAMVHQTHVLVHDVRPPLGIIVFNDGSTFVVDSDYVVGREPEQDPRVKTGRARPIALENDGVISRAHLLIQLEGWNVYVVDRSANGTELASNGQWHRLEKNSATILQPGAEVRFGRYRFSFDSHHKTG